MGQVFGLLLMLLRDFPPSSTVCVACFQCVSPREKKQIFVCLIQL